MKTRGLVFALMATMAAAQADTTLVDLDLASGAPEGKLTPTSSTIPNITEWTGPQKVGEWGSVEIDAPPAQDGAPGSALVFLDKGPGNMQGPILNVKTADWGANATHGSATLKLLVPVGQPYRAEFYFGGARKDGAATLVLSDGEIKIWSEGALTGIGSYTSNQWEELRVDFDFVQKTYAVLWNGVKLDEGVGWANPALANLGRIQIFANASSSDNEGGPVLYLSKILVTEGGAP